ncbi:thiamine pyrophosphate-binding protein [Microbacterium pseudoresistens]|uniref:Sulfopyruvate decarboxylase subunit alpha n=1 Tax=Microbacterium pseudoresistens TaxID=640634 RepID=A0A7Y9JMH1_9MICO|nr:thiamine pyrophosphate-binding protein [Microbacterium pseudoresistens]NYD54370.1 sulfopyruvate decarboxylase subunit alpha [Microbacterium pseudoresistens]
MTYASAVADAIRESDIDVVGYVPSVTIAPVIKHLIKAREQSLSAPNVIQLSREEEAMGVLGALPFAGKLGAVIMQDNGFGNALTAMTTFLQSYHLPLLIFANTRGGLGEYNSMIHSISQPMPGVLRAFGFAVFEIDFSLDEKKWGQVVREAVVHAVMTYRPVVVLASFWGTDGKVA